MKKPWIKPTDRMPEHCQTVFIAMLDVQFENFCYYVGWYDDNRKEWFLTDFGYVVCVSFWMPIPELEVSDL